MEAGEMHVKEWRYPLAVARTWMQLSKGGLYREASYEGQGTAGARVDRRDHRCRERMQEKGDRSPSHGERVHDGRHDKEEVGLSRRSSVGLERLRGPGRSAVVVPSVGTIGARPAPMADHPVKVAPKERPMRFESFSFGSIRIDGVTYEHDVVIDRGQIRKRKKKRSQKFRDTFGHTPLSIEEEIPWKCERLVVGTGTGALPVMDEVEREAARRKIALVIVPTARAIALLEQQSADTNAILHVTC
jgi:hypothetical protein